MTDHEWVVRSSLEDHITLAARTRDELAPLIAELAAHLVATLSGGGKLVVFGNGGSAADAQHLAAELMGRFGVQRGPLAAIALTTDTSVLTAIANDFEYAEVFARQAEALCLPGDLALGISTTGQAESVVRGLRAANRMGARTWALSGGDGGRLRQEASRSIIVPSDSTARIQEMHLAIIHLVCQLVDVWVSEGGLPADRDLPG